jgi:hypothetical protein
MQDATAAEAAARGTAAGAVIALLKRRRRALATCAALALCLHAFFLGGAASWSPGETAEPAAPPMSVRTVAAEPEPPADAAAPAAIPVPAASPAPKPRSARRPRAPSTPPAEIPEEARAHIEESAPSPAAPEASAPTAAVIADEAAPPPSLAEAVPEPAASAVAADGAEPPGASASAAQPPLLATGEVPPPIYRTRLPPSATLRYEVRRGFLRGTGEIRWRASDDTYRLVLEARIAGLTLLIQTSEGVIDATGLAPVRFVDQRARRSAQAANFRRDIDAITYSGAAAQWPLLPGSQDRLSWMIQLAGIAAADPGLLVEGGRISMVVVGVRGDATVWTLRCAGREDVETARGTVHAVKLVRDARSAYDTIAEIWLDPENDYFPAHATLRNSGGASEYDLLLERIEPAP